MSKRKGGKGSASSSKPAESLGSSVWFGGATLALVVVAILSTALPKTYYTHIIGGIAFLYFGAKLLADSRVNKKQSRATKTKRAEEAADEDDMPPLENAYGEDARLATSSNVIPSDASCFLCFGEGPDEDGQPLLRDCSCRGDSGIAHFKCLVEYAKDKSLKLDHVLQEQGSGEAFTTPWLACCTCHQEYQNALALKLMNELVPFTIRSFPCNAEIQCPEFPCDPVAYAEALQAKSHVLYSMMHDVALQGSDRASHRAENKKINEDILVVLTTLKEHLRNRSVEDGFGGIPKGIIWMEARAHVFTGICIVESVEMEGAGRGELKSAMEHFDKGRALYTSIGNIELAAKVDPNIALAKTLMYSEEPAPREDIINTLYRRYKEKPDSHTAETLVMDLIDEKRIIECERFIFEHLVLSRRTHGPNHAKTRFMEAQLKEVRVRLVSLTFPASDRGIYEALRYEDDGKKCVLRGPYGKIKGDGSIVAVRSIVAVKEEKKKTIIANTEHTVLIAGTPVVCHGLKNASHLNGKIGDARSFDKKEKRYSVHFENNRLKPRRVREQNLRILFDLPPKEH